MNFIPARKVTTVEEYDATGRLVKKTVTTEDVGLAGTWISGGSYPAQTTKWWEPQPKGTITYNVGTWWPSDNDDDEPDDGVGAKV